MASPFQAPSTHREPNQYNLPSRSLDIYCIFKLITMDKFCINTGSKKIDNKTRS